MSWVGWQNGVPLTSNTNVTLIPTGVTELACSRFQLHATGNPKGLMLSTRLPVAPIFAAALVSWGLGAYAVYVVTAQYTGLGLWESYSAFQGGSNFGNVLWFVIWSGTTCISSWWLARDSKKSLEQKKTVPYVLLAYAVPSLVVLLPDAAMGFAVSHVRAFNDETYPHSEIVEFLTQSGIVALAGALTWQLVVTVRHRRKPREDLS